MAAAAPEGARMVFLTGADRRLDVAARERGLDLIWRAGAPVAVSDAAWSARRHSMRWPLEEWSPVNLKGVWTDADIALSWVRRARKDGDPWTPVEPPVSGRERYQVSMSGPGVLREWQVGEPVADHVEADRLTDFPAGGEALIEVSQPGPDGQPGGRAALQIVIPTP